MLEPVKIPQNVYVEDRIIGPITLRHLIVCGIGTGISYAMYSMAAKAGSVSLAMTIALWTPAAISAAFAFVKINDLSLFNIILLLIERIDKPAQRVWSARPGISVNFVSSVKAPESETNKKLAENVAKLTELTRQMEKREQEMARLADHSIRRTSVLSEVTAPTTQSTPLSARGEEQTEGQQTATRLAFAQAAQAQAEAEVQIKAVNPSRVTAQGLDPSRSVDGVSDSLKSFEHIFKKP